MEATSPAPAVGMLRLLRRLAAWRRWRLAAGLATLLGVGLAALPQLEVIGFEAAFFSGLILPFAAGALGAGLRRSGLDPTRPLAALGAVALAGLSLPCFPLAVLAVNQLRAPVCDPGQGVAFFLLLPFASCLYAALLGGGLALAIRSPRRALAAFVGLALLAVAVPVWRFFATPAVSFYGPLFGLYPGAIYDALIPVSAPLVTYRLTNLVELALLAAVAGLAWDPAAERLRLRRLAGRRAAPWIVLPLAGAVFAGWLFGPALGHRTSAERLARELGAWVPGEACDLYGPRAALPGDLRLLAQDCDWQVHRHRRRLGLSGPGPRIAVFVFPTEAAKAAAMGAGRTSIAKPWRREVYVQWGELPHEVLSHELAHAVLAELGRPPFGVPARWGGLLPLPGLIEGAAVALEWPHDGLSPHGWAAAMKRLHLLPPADTLLGVGFFAEAAGPAYTAMGSFVRWLLDGRGAAPFARVYRDGDFEAAYGRPLEALWAEWGRFLEAQPLDPTRLEAARARFDLPGFFALRCPHAVAEQDAEAERLWAAGRVEESLSALREACRLSGEDPRRRLVLLSGLVDARRPAEAEAEAERLLANGGLGARLRDLVLRLQADARWLAGHPAAAHPVYAELAERTLESGERRLLQVKAFAASTPEAEPHLREYLFGRGPGAPPPGSPESLAALRAWIAAQPREPLAHYLHGRALAAAGRGEEAEAALHWALELGPESPDVRREAVRLLVVLAWRAGDLDQLEWDAEVLQAIGDEGYGAEATQWLERAAWLRARGTP